MIFSNAFCMAIGLSSLSLYPRGWVADLCVRRLDLFNVSMMPLLFRRGGNNGVLL